MDIHGNKPIPDSIIITDDDDSKKHDPNDLHFEELYKGIRVGQPVPANLRIDWDVKNAKEGIMGIVRCSRKDLGIFKRLDIMKHQASGLIASCHVYTEDSRKDFTDDFYKYWYLIEMNFNVPSQPTIVKDRRKVVFRFATTTLVLEYYYPADDYHSLDMELFHNDVEHLLDKERAARGYFDWKLDDEWDNERWLRESFK